MCEKEPNFKIQKDKMARCEDVLELIHTDICGPFTLTALGGYRYFYLPSLMIYLVMDMLSLSVRSRILWLHLRSLR